jgi:mono/diheme cytochrome c family protein
MTARRRGRFHPVWQSATACGAALLGLILMSAPASSAPKLSEKEFKDAEFIYFDRCSGCHGALRKGATGPNITAEKMLKKDLAKLEETIYDGTDAGMPRPC